MFNSEDNAHFSKIVKIENVYSAGLWMSSNDDIFVSALVREITGIYYTLLQPQPTPHENHVCEIMVDSHIPNLRNERFLSDDAINTKLFIPLMIKKKETHDVKFNLEVALLGSITMPLTFVYQLLYDTHDERHMSNQLTQVLMQEPTFIEKFPEPKEDFELVDKYDLLYCPFCGFKNDAESDLCIKCSKELKS